jgi:ribulose-5-phosphate 4-epimerase/fuculose-1-phosphate aldolase
VIDERTTVARLKQELRWNQRLLPPGEGLAMADHAELRERVFEGNRELVRAGLVVLTFGNVSGSTASENVLAIKPSGSRTRSSAPRRSSSSTLETGDVVAGDARPRRTRRRTSSSTAASSARRDRPHALPLRDRLGAGGRELPCFGTTHADHFRGPVPVTRALDRRRDPRRLRGADRRRDRRDVRKPRARSARDSGRPRGIARAVRLGRDVAQAVENALALETVAELALYTLVLKSETSALDDALLERHFSRKHGPDAYYGQPR